MRKARVTEEQMVAIIREVDRDPVAALAEITQGSKDGVKC